MDELADIIGCKPTFKDFIFTDPVLAFKLVESPVFPYNYRLKGPHTWVGARKAIFEAENRIRQGFIPAGGVHQSKKDNFAVTTPYIIAFMILILAIWGFTN